jgi:chlorobactene glucosyltransferase
MLIFLISICWLVLLLCFLYALSKLYYGREFIPTHCKTIFTETPFLTVIIPARNEEENIERCLFSLLDQSYPHDRYEIIVVDDNSTDTTASIICRMQALDSRLQLIEAGELPDGWKGKNHACWKGAEHARGELFCFVDADVTAEPELLESAVRFARFRQIDMLSINPFQELVSISERLLLPGVFISIASSMDFKRVNDPARPEAVANGQFLLFERSAYESLRGHDAVRDEIMEDLAFARLAKKSGLRLYWIFGDALIRTRMYATFSQIWEGFSKNLTEVMGIFSIPMAMVTSVKSLLLGWMPLVLPLLTGYGLLEGGQGTLAYLAFAFSLLASCAFFAYSALAVRALKIPIYYFLSFPLGLTLHAMLSINSAWKKHRGGRKWKGRMYA